jgi:hypothetical protein
VDRNRATDGRAGERLATLSLVGAALDGDLDLETLLRRLAEALVPGVGDSCEIDLRSWTSWSVRRRSPWTTPGSSTD